MKEEKYKKWERVWSMEQMWNMILKEAYKGETETRENETIDKRGENWIIISELSKIEYWMHMMKGKTVDVIHRP